MTLRTLLLNEAFDQVSRSLTLRRPQRDALRKVHEWIEATTQPLRDLDPADRVFSFRERFPSAADGAAFPQGVFSLATGVGKTRLMAAIIAYLYRAGESENFLILAPRRAILRQIVAQLRPTSTKYLFGSEALVPQPRVWHADNLERFGLPSQELEVGLGPGIFVFSPQSFTGERSERRAARPSSDFSDTSILEYLETSRDLVVLIDEAHHIPSKAGAERRAWTSLARQLNPMVQFGFTATPLPDERDNVLYEYDLAQCLAEGLYTKGVRVFVEERPTSSHITDQDWDRLVLEFGLSRLAAKRAALAEANDRGLSFPSISPVMLVSAESTSHANEIGRWLIEDKGLAADEVLVTHSARSKPEDELERLMKIDQPGSRVKVVVNVMELSEGWDVTNVYAVAPLRSMATFTTAVQTMGRGLRLPAGQRVGVPELDQLDVLCFGREKFEDILSQALERFGTDDGAGSGIDVKRKSDSDSGTADQLTRVAVGAPRQISVTLPLTVLDPPRWDITAIHISEQGFRSRNVVGFDLKRLERFSIEGEVTLSLDAFVARATELVLQRLSFLSISDRPWIEQQIRQQVGGLVQETGRVRLDPLLAAEHVAAVLRDAFYHLPRRFRLSGQVTETCFGPYEIELPVGATAIHKPTIKWTPSLHRRRLIGPWRRSVHDANVFDSDPEFQLAKILDQSSSVEWWARNDPVRLKIRTPAGDYWPDFVVRARVNNTPINVLIGVKGEHLWDSPETSEARVKAVSAANFAKTVTEAGGGPLEHWLVLGGDIEGCRAVEDVRKVVVELGSYLRTDAYG